MNTCNPSGTDRDESDALRARVHDAIADLSELHSTDPAARSAVHAVRLARLTLECFWAPALIEPSSDDGVDGVDVDER